jgi:molecular chaperone DnaK
MSRPLLGIDLGTTNSVVASIDDAGRVVVLRNAVGEEVTPSAVYFESADSVLVGDEARRAVAIDPGNGVTLIKRQMGTEFPLSFHGQEHTPESISALILRQLVAAATVGSGESPAVVITVPAYFGTAEREATYQAGRIAGVEVLELLDEPVAAAVHYGLTSGSDRTVLVYDLGGGTFDTTILRILAGEVEVVATDGHSALGGADVDKRLLDIVLERLSRVVPEAEYDDLLDDSALLGTLIVDIEIAKRDLSLRTSRDLVIRTSQDRFTIELTRSDLEGVCRDLFDSTFAIVERVRDKALQKGVRVVDEVVMVGGSSRIPLLAEELGVRFDVTPRLVEPDLAVAKGAALRAHQLVGSSQLRALSAAAGITGIGSAGKVTPVAPRAVGLLIEDSFDPSGKRSMIEHLIDANTSLPVSRTEERFGTILANQETVRLQVFEQAGPAPSPEVEHNRRVLDGELTGLGELPAGSLIRITLAVAVDGRLTLTAVEPVSGRELTLEAFVEGVVDGADTERLTRVVGLTAVRG